VATDRTSRAIVSPLASWFVDEAAVRRFRAGRLAGGPVALAPRDRGWRSIVPAFEAVVAMAAAGVPFQIAIDRRYDRSGDPRRLRPALARGATVYLPQVHQVLPRLARLIVALRAAVMGPGREECSFLFAVEGRGREGMGLHHDGDVEGVWLQIEGRRTVTTGPPVPRGAPADLDERRASGPAWVTRDLAPGTLFYLPPRTPHRVVCRGRSLAVSLTWGRRAGAGARASLALADWDVASGRVDAIPRRDGGRLWTQVPAVAGRAGRRRGVPVRTGDGVTVWLPASARRLAAVLAVMPSVRGDVGLRPAVEALVAHGILAPYELPLRVVPDDARALDGWRFA
jgi:hypothetical protein